MLRAAYCSYNLEFKQPAVTSREVMHSKLTYFIKVWDDAEPNVYGLGECALFKGLSCEDPSRYNVELAHVCHDINLVATNPGEDLLQWPSIRFGVESALADLRNGGRRILFPGQWTDGEMAITINGLVWMGSKEQMFERLKAKIDAGFRCIKLKIGGIDFKSEVEMLKYIRTKFSSEVLEIRLDANGAFTPQNALQRLDRLSHYNIHSLEQPIRAGQPTEMARICRKSPISIALDEELIGVNTIDAKRALLECIKPQYIILKPALVGGFSGSEEWIRIAESMNIGWWATSALESNIGLNAIAQWVSTLNPSMPQGLGTGALYVNNIPSPIEQIGQTLSYNPNGEWQMPQFNWIEP